MPNGQGGGPVATCDGELASRAALFAGLNRSLGQFSEFCKLPRWAPAPTAATRVRLDRLTSSIPWTSALSHRFSSLKNSFLKILFILAKSSPVACVFRTLGCLRFLRLNSNGVPSPSPGPWALFCNPPVVETTGLFRSHLRR